MSVTNPVLLLSPTHRRLVALNMDSERDAACGRTLVDTFGWTAYAGETAAVDGHGFVIPGSDPEVRPQPVEPRTVRG